MDGAEFTGMFDGAPGTYTCVSMCELSTNLDAELVDVGGDWQFAPDDDEFLVPVDDSDFVHFGYWQNETEVAGDSTYMVAPHRRRHRSSPRSAPSKCWRAARLTLVRRRVST